METIVKFMEKTGTKEFKLFLKLYKNMPKDKFAVVKAGGKTLKAHIDLIAEDIAFLNKMGIFPAIVHGAGPMLNKALGGANKIDGIRVTSAEDMKVIESVFAEIAGTLAEKICLKGGKAEKVGPVFKCKALEKYGRVGKIEQVELNKIENVFAKNATPIISPIGKAECGKVNINADTAAKELVKAIEAKKFILLTETGGILDEKGEILPFLNTHPNEAPDFVSGGMLVKIKEVKEFLESGTDCAVVITSAENLLKEIFTIKGSGTFIKNYEIKSTANAGGEEKKKLEQLIENSFGKKLVDGYFDSGIKEVLFHTGFEGVAVIKELNGLNYLDKFAVAKHCQGTGLGTSLWDELEKKYKSFVWRAKTENEVNKFYAEKCDGMMKKEEWNIYWKGIGEKKVLGAVECAAALKETLQVKK